jgi:site-specific DNA-methyltransferase (adenine-specific)
MIELLNVDCMEYMKGVPDKYFDLALVDPNYGINRMHSGGMGNNGFKQWDRKDWDKERPSKEYFIELFRVSKNQIIWGGNYFTDYLFPSMGWIFWFKQKGMTFADGELAWTSFDRATRQYDMSGMGGGNRIHPTQKPIKLYSWIYKNYLPNGGKVIDTHLGSGSNAIAAHKAGNIDFVGTEIDTEYFNAMQKRFDLVTSQTSLF